MHRCHAEQRAWTYYYSDEETRAGCNPHTINTWFAEIVRGFKTISSRPDNESRHNPGCPVWQRDYYDRVIRDGNELTHAQAYIVNNPLKWEHDRENTANST
jgi:hypothetical protein